METLEQESSVNTLKIQWKAPTAELIKQKKEIVSSKTGSLKIHGQSRMKKKQRRRRNKEMF